MIRMIVSSNFNVFSGHVQKFFYLELTGYQNKRFCEMTSLAMFSFLCGLRIFSKQFNEHSDLYIIIIRYSRESVFTECQSIYIHLSYIMQNAQSKYATCEMWCITRWCGRGGLPQAAIRRGGKNGGDKRASHDFWPWGRQNCSPSRVPITHASLPISQYE